MFACILKQDSMVLNHENLVQQSLRHLLIGIHAEAMLCRRQLHCVHLHAPDAWGGPSFRDS